MSDFRQAQIPLGIDVHLAHAAHSRNAPVMRYESDAPRPGSGADQPETPANHRAKAVSSDNDAALKLAPRVVGGVHHHTVYAASMITRKVGNPRAFLDTRSGVSGPPEQDLVEDSSPQSEAPVSESREALYARELGVDGLTVRRAQSHPRQLGSACFLDFFEHTHVGEYPRRLGAQILRAHLVARKVRAIENQNVDPLFGERPRGCRSRGPAADDDDVGVPAFRVSQPTARETR